MGTLALVSCSAMSSSSLAGMLHMDEVNCCSQAQDKAPLLQKAKSK